MSDGNPPTQSGALHPPRISGVEQHNAGVQAFSDNEAHWKEAKRRHQELSDVAAAEYDRLYAASNFATGSYMAYELDIIDRAVAQIDKNNRRIALDLGCGTGRDAFYFHKHFVQVRAYDFSEEMIRVAQQKKLQKAAGNVQFILRDIEEDLLTDIDNASVSFVGSGFGMGSFIRDLGVLLREVKRVLEPGGIFVVSFYNRESLVVQIDTLEWAPSLAARLDVKTGMLTVSFRGDTYDVAVRAYSVTEVRDKLSHYFDVVDLTTYPTLSSLLPNSIFSSKHARELCTVVDRALRGNPDIAGGPYIIAVCRKKGKLDADPAPIGYMNIMRLLNDNRVALNIKEHAPVKSTDEVADLLSIDRTVLIKSILIKVHQSSPDEETPPQSGPAFRYYAVILQANRFMAYDKVADVLKVKRRQIDLASIDEVEEMTGFSIGGIPPFGYPRSINAILDSRIKAQDMVYCGTGKRTELLRVSVADLVKLACPVVADISKEIETK